MKAASVTFGPNSPAYDYRIPEGMELKPGDKVIVDTRRGEAKATVVEVKDHSDKATAYIVRKFDPNPKPQGKWDF